MIVIFFFFFKQKTAYEMRISDWSSDVCSSDLNHANDIAEEPYGRYENIGTMPPGGTIAKPSFTISPNGNVQLGPLFLMEKMEAGWHPESKNWRYKIGRASCRERVCQYV